MATDSKKVTGRGTKVVWDHNRDHGEDVNPIIIGLQQTIGNQGIQTLIGSDASFDFRNIPIQPKLRMSHLDDLYEQEADRVAENVMSIPSSSPELSMQLSNTPIEERLDRKCSACEMKEKEEETYTGLQISRKSTRSNNLQTSEEPAEEINYISTSEGAPLNTATRQFMESRFGYDFSDVRVHTDERSARSAKSVNALAYTIGNDIVFDEGMYMPNTLEGGKLLAHELAHVVQQTVPGYLGADTYVPTEDEASERNAGIIANLSIRVNQRVGSGTIQRQQARPIPKPLDINAERIVSVVMPNPRDKRDRKTKAVELVFRILNQYFPGYASKVSGVGFDNEKAGRGLLVESQMSQTRVIYGFIWVGDAFVDQLIEDKFTFASHVSKVAHELEHIDQWRSGMVGEGNKNEREFLAHFHESVFVERPGTGSIYHTSRARHADAALGLYHCLESNLQKKYEGIKKELLARRTDEARYGHKDKYPDPPTTCKQPEEFGFGKE